MKKNILVIDDDSSTRVLIRFVLEKAGYCVFEAANGMKGIQIFNKNKIDLIVTDIIMPEKEGLETIIELRKTCPEIKIIAISAGEGDVSKQNEYLDLANNLGADQVVGKPIIGISKERLLNSVKALLG